MKQIRKCALLLINLLYLGAHAQVRVDNYGDTLKGNIQKMTQLGVFIIRSPDGSTTGITKSIYTCDTSNGVELIRFYTELDKEAAREEIRFDSKGHVLEDNSYTDLDSLYKRCTYKYDVHGRQIEKREINYPFHASYPLEEGEVGISFKDSFGYSIKYTYDNMDFLAGKTELETWDARTTTDNLAAYKYDTAGRKTEEYELNLRGCGEEERYVLFYVGGKGYATKTVFTYDSLLRLATSTEYSELKIPDSSLHEKHTGVFIGIKTVYNYRGKSDIADDITSISLFREDNDSITTATPWTHPNWAMKTYETLEYDKHGNVIRKVSQGQLIFDRTIEYFK